MKKMFSWCTAGERTTKGETCADQMTDSFQAHKDDTAICVSSALVNRLHCTDVCCERVSCLHHPSILRNSFQETEITTISQMMYVATSSNSFAIAKSATPKLKMKMKMLPAGFPVALCNTAVQSCDRHSNRSLLLLRIADFVVDAVDVVDVLVSEFVLFPTGEHLAFSGIVSMHRQILVAVGEVFGAHQHSY